MSQSDRSVHDRYQAAAAEPWRLPFREIVTLATPRDDDELAALIDCFGRDRVERGLSVEVSMFLQSIEGLAHRRVVLDAVIDMSLRSASRGDQLDPAAIDALRLNYP